jgi:ATP-binding cassette subfamily B protein
MVFVLWPRADVSAQRVLEVLDTEPTVANGTKKAEDVAKTGQTGTVEFRNVSFSYPDSREAMLEGISFSAEKGQTVAFIGSTGSGKSSLVNLVPRFYDASQGQVLVDGVDVRDYDLKTLRDKIGYVPQQSVLFKGTVAGNVSYGDKPGDSADVELADTSRSSGRRREAELIAAGQASDGVLADEQMANVRASCDVAQASEFVEQMEGGFEAAIAQGGSNVSGGQKQRLSIARAVYRHPEIMIFDDSFSALDFKTDREVRDALASQAKDSTKLIIAQRIGTIMDADRIVVLDDGKVVGQGTHKELLEHCDIYRQIAESQLSQSELTA